MIAKAKILFFIICLISTCLLLFFIFLKYPSDEKNYSLDLGKNTSKQTPYQERKGVKKDIWLENSKNEHIHIESDYSEIFLVHNLGKVNIIENLTDFFCLIDEKNTNKSYFVTSNQGNYTLPYNQLLANDVDLYFFSKTPTLPINLYDASLHGFAKQFILQIGQKQHSFVAEKFNCNFMEKNLE